MPKPRSPNRDKAFEIFKKHNGEIENRRIAEQLNENEKLIAVWKSRDGWLKKNNDVQQTNDVHQTSNENCTSKPYKKTSSNNSTKKSASKKVKNNESGTPDKTNTQNPKARFGNNNAAGNKGGLGGPTGNSFAVKTNEYRNLFFKGANLDLDENKRAVLDADYDRYTRQLILIDTLTYREMLILEEMHSLKEHPSGMIIESVTKNKGTTTHSYTNRNKNQESWEGNSSTEAVDTATHVARAESERRDRLGEALTRVQGRLQKAIEVWHKMEMDSERVEIDRTKLELQRQRISGQIDLDELLDGDDLGLELEE